MKKIKSILVAVDFSEISVKALQTALDLAEQINAKLDVVHTLPMSEIDLPAEGSAEFNRGLVQQELEKTKDKLNQFVKELSNENIDINELICLGDPKDEINKIAQSINPDMIVVGTHGRKGLSHLLMGSVAESIVRNAIVPVLCVRYHE